MEYTVLKSLNRTIILSSWIIFIIFTRISSEPRFYIVLFFVDIVTRMTSDLIITGDVYKRQGKVRPSMVYIVKLVNIKNGSPTT